MRPGLDRPSLDFHNWLCHRVTQGFLGGITCWIWWCCEGDGCFTTAGFRSVTRIAVLKYSRSCVIRFSLTVHICTQNSPGVEEEPLPSTKTLLAMPRTLMGSNAKVSQDVTPVSKRIICCWVGGPWNHHSRSSATKACTLAASPSASAEYSVRTTRSLLICSSASSCSDWISFARSSLKAKLHWSLSHTHTHTGQKQNPNTLQTKPSNNQLVMKQRERHTHSQKQRIGFSQRPFEDEDGGI